PRPRRQGGAAGMGAPRLAPRLLQAPAAGLGRPGRFALSRLDAWRAPAEPAPLLRVAPPRAPVDGGRLDRRLHAADPLSLPVLSVRLPDLLGDAAHARTQRGDLRAPPGGLGTPGGGRAPLGDPARVDGWPRGDRRGFGHRACDARRGPPGRPASGPPLL